MCGMETSDPIKVLLVDDEDRFRQTTAGVLKKRGFNVFTASNGVDAIERIKKDDFDVVILDIKMPDMDGHRTLREIRKLKSEARVIMLTAFGSMDSALEALRDEVFAYLSKPCDIELLALRIREAVGMKSTACRWQPDEAEGEKG